MQPMQQKGQSRQRGTLIENDFNNEPKSSFVAKWNNYSHYNHTVNLTDTRPSQPQSRQTLSSSLKKEWLNNCKPSSFNKLLNTDLPRNPSSTSISRSRHNLSTSSLNKNKPNINSSKNNQTYNNHQQSNNE